MTLRQKLTIAILAIANVLVILLLTTLALRSFGAATSPLSTPIPLAEALTRPPQPDDRTEPIRTARPQEPTAMLPQEGCQWDAAQMLAQAGLGGTAALTPDGMLRFEIAYALPSGETADAAAQLVWVAFDVASALQEQDCKFTWVEVTVLARRDQSATRISAGVSAADLAAFGAGELGESEFIERVTYTTFRLP